MTARLDSSPRLLSLLAHHDSLIANIATLNHLESLVRGCRYPGLRELLSPTILNGRMPAK